MMGMLRLLICLLATLVLSTGARAANPFLNAPDDKPVAANFKGTEWGDEIGPKDLPLGARVVTTRVAQMPWGAVFKVSFDDIASRAKPRRTLPPLYFIATENEIVLLNEEKPDEAVRRLSALSNAPKFEPADFYGISQGTRTHEDGTLAESTIAVKGDLCTYQWSHNSGHFTTVVWKKGVGLIEYAQGRGARADGYRLKREFVPPSKRKN